jgi:hypothetical protein
MKLWLVFAAVAATTVSTSALAQAPRPPAHPPGGAPAAAAAGATGVKTIETGKEGYGYSFVDDPLGAGGFGPNDANIRVRVSAARVTLIRPRTSFVTEMLKSVENI